MGYLDNGVWIQGRRPSTGGAFARRDSFFRDQVTPDGYGRFQAEAGRYHLFVSLACPWASRTIIVRKLKRLEGAIGMTVVDPDMLENGWTFGGATEPLTGARYLHEIYTKAEERYSGAVTVPVLWDKKSSKIVNNESSEIIRILNSAFDEWGDAKVDLYPPEFRSKIDEINDRIYPSLNNGVYRAGFATSQAAYEEAATDVFRMLDEIETQLGKTRFLVGPALTEADVRLFTTAVRFDLVYYSHFKCNVCHLSDYANVSAWMRDVYQTHGIEETVDLKQIKRHYYHSQTWLNPTGIVPVGPTVDLDSAHGREKMTARAM